MRRITPPSLIQRALMALVVPLLAVLTFGAAPAQAQSPTPEGTTITNTATVSYTDANSNTYADVSDSVDVLVGFQGGLSTVGQADVTPPANTGGLLLSFDVINGGNGVDTVSVATSVANGTTVISSIDGYRLIIGGVTTSYADLAALNTFLDTYELAAGDTITVVVEYTTSSGSGGLNDDITMQITSDRDADVQSDSVNVAPSLTGEISITQPTTPAQKLPSGGANPTYSLTFPVYSSLAGSANVSLTASLSGSNDAGIVIQSVNGVAGTSTSSTFTFNSTQNITVVYTVANNAAGSTSGITLTADGGVSSDAKTVTVEIIKPALTITKGVFSDAALTTDIENTEITPGTTLYYRIAVSNLTGTAPASSVEIEDVLPPQVTYVSASQVTALSGVSISEDTGTVTVTKASLATGATLVVRIQVTVN